MGHTANIHKSVYQMNADIAKNTIVPTLLFKMLHNVSTPDEISEEGEKQISTHLPFITSIYYFFKQFIDAEEIIYNRMVAFEPFDGTSPTSSDDTNQTSNSTALGSSNDDICNDESSDCESNEALVAIDDSPNLESFTSPQPSTSFTSITDDTIESDRSLDNVSNFSDCSTSTHPSIIFPDDVPITQNPVINSPSPVTPSSENRLRLSPTTPTNLIPTVLLKRLSPALTRSKRRLFPEPEVKPTDSDTTVHLKNLPSTLIRSKRPFREPEAEQLDSYSESDDESSSDDYSPVKRKKSEFFKNVGIEKFGHQFYS